LFKNKFESEDKKQYSGGKGVSAAGGILFSISPYLGLIALAI
jgi:glycerol-3-phosphate acyltransferase PlsY